MTNEKLAEMLAAAEKATPGPWMTEPTGDGMADMRIFAQPAEYRHRIVIANVAPQKSDADAFYLARLDPQTITDILIELQSLRSQLSGITEETRAPSAVFAAWVNAGPKLALAAGVYVDITVYAKDPTK